jgi:hypothetical protein
VKKVGVVLCALAALCVGGSANADPVPPTPPADLHSCTLPGAAPYWFDYVDGAVPYWRMFARPGVIAAAPNLQLPAQIRALGGTTVYFDLHLKERVGVPSAPTDPSTIDARADRLFLYVENSTHCSNPVIAENELYGAGLPTPWSPTTAQYRANVLEFLRRLAADGGQPWLLVNSPPSTAGDAGDWWRSVAQVAGFVREVYFNANLIYAQGPVLGSRNLRQAFRNAALDFTQIGIPTSKLGIFLGFQTTRGTGGREGLKPAAAWFETVKLQALAAKQVAKDMHLNAIWSWGWAEYSTEPSEHDPDKPRAACVYLWTRDPKLCNGPAAAGKGFDRSRTEGQLTLPRGLRCTVGGYGPVRWSAIRPIVSLTGDQELAFSNVYARTLESRLAHVTTAQVLAAERSIVLAHFGGSRSAYLAALSSGHASLSLARAVIADELRRKSIELRFAASPPSGADIADYQQTSGELQARLVQTARSAAWLGGRKLGYALASNAPTPVMAIASGRWSQVWSPTGTMRVRPLGEPVPLGSVPLSRTRPSIRAALIAQARDERYPTWIAVQMARSLSSAVCWRDELPQTGAADLTDYLPFLSLAPTTASS